MTSSTNNTFENRVNELADRGLQQAGKPKITHAGTRETYTYVKDGGDFGKMGAILPIIGNGLAYAATAAVGSKKAEGFKEATNKAVTEFKNNPEIVGPRLVSTVATVATVIGAPYLLASQKVRDETVNNMLHGQITREVSRKIEKTKDELKKEHAKDTKARGFDCQDSKKMTAFVKQRAHAKDSRVREIKDHIVFVGKDYIVVVPNGNFEEHEKVFLYKGPFFSESGEYLTEDVGRLRAINAFLTGRTEIVEGIEKKAEEIALKVKGEKPENLSEAESKKWDKQAEELKKQIVRNLSAKEIRISVKYGYWRIASDDPTNPDLYQNITGVFKDETIKEFDVLYNRNLSEHKKKLEGNDFKPPKLTNDLFNGFKSSLNSDNEDDDGKKTVLSDNLESFNSGNSNNSNYKSEYTSL